MKGKRSIFWVARCFLLLVLLDGVVTSASAAVLLSSPVTISTLYTYPQFGGGDVVVQVSQPLAGCESGFWLSASDPGFKSVYAQLLLARAARTVLSIWAYSDQIWTGSSGNTCRIQAVGDLQN